MQDTSPHAEPPLAGRYQIQSELGRGGMATVYLARDTKHDRLVALKMLRPEIAAAIGTERFLREIEITSRLAHPHIVPLYDSGIVPPGVTYSGPYYAMPYVQGESLRARLQREAQLPISEALGIARQVADALDHAHQHHIVHRDIKPENILLAGSHAMVADFGIARALEAAGGERLTATGLAVGSPFYASPEQGAGDSTRTDRRSDVYSLGCVVFEMLSGQPPFTGRTAQAILARHAVDPVPPLRSVRPTVPASVERVVSKALAKVPADRWGTPGEFARALETSDGDSGRTDAKRRLFKGTLLITTALLALVAGYLMLASTRGGVSRTLLSSGVLRERERILVADFDARGDDTVLAGTVTMALRIDLSQSPAVAILPSSQVTDVLNRMQRPARTRIDATMAREIGIREGIKAVITGQLASAGTGHVMSAELVTAESGEVLAAARESVADSSDLIPAVGRLSKQLRERIGEPLRSLQARPPLARVTTRSLEALRKYALAVRTREREGNDDRAIALLDEAIAIDTGFAMAYQARAMFMASRFSEYDRTIEMFKKALARSDRLPERERNLTRAAYHSYMYEPDQAIAAYRSLLDVYPEDVTALRGLGLEYAGQRDYARAESLFRRAGEIDSLTGNLYSMLSGTQVDLGKWDDARTTLKLGSRRLPDHPRILWTQAMLEASQGRLEAGAARARVLLERHGEVPVWRGQALELLAQVAAVRGRLREAEAHWRDAIEASVDTNVPYLYTQNIAHLYSWHRNEPRRGEQELNILMRRHPLSAVRLRDRPYLRLSVGYSSAGRPDRARALLDDFVHLIVPGERRMRESIHRWARGYLALAEGRYADAVSEFRQGDRGPCGASCGLGELGIAYDRLGEADSAIAAYERYLERPSMIRIDWDAHLLARTYERLGELYRDKGNRERAVEYYSKFIGLWKDCDPELQPRVAAARAAISVLSP